MLSSQEQRIWDDVQRFWAEEAEEPPVPVVPLSVRRQSAWRDPADLPVLVVAGAWITIVLLIFGAALAALAIAAATALGWALWQHRARLREWTAPSRRPVERQPDD